MDKNLKGVEEFFHAAIPEILDLVRKNLDKNSIIRQKQNTEHGADFATEIDVLVERKLTGAVAERFPDDSILAEEENPETSLQGPGRLWIVDPICGTLNFARGLPLYVSNIALAEHGKLAASCVVDHLSGKYFWSTGNGVYEGIEPARIQKNRRGTIVDIDLGALPSAPQDVKDRYAKFVERMCRETDITLVALNSSISFLFVALGIYDGFANPYAHAWDLAASIFLIQQAGGIVTDLEGKPWSVETPNAVGALNPTVHATLMKYLQN